jgi:hypothetical protein
MKARVGGCKVAHQKRPAVMLSTSCMG